VGSCFERWTRVASGRGRGVLGAGRGVQRGNDGGVGLGREWELDAGGGGHLQEERLVRFHQDPALGVPDLETEVGRRRAGEDRDDEEVVLGRVDDRLLEQFTRGLTAEHVLEGQVRVLPASGAEVVDEVLEGLLDRVRDRSPDLGSETTEGGDGHLAVSARGQESDSGHAIHGGLPERVAQEGRAGARVDAVQAGPEEGQPVDVELGLLKLTELGVADLPGEAPGDELDRVPVLLDAEDLLRDESILDDEGLALLPQRSDFATEPSDDPEVTPRPIQVAEIPPLPDRGEAQGGRGAGGLEGQEAGGPTEVVADLLDLLPGLAGALGGEAVDDVVVPGDLSAVAEAQGHGPNPAVLPPGLRVEVPDEDAVHGLTGPDLTSGLIDGHVGDQPSAPVAQDRRLDLDLDPLVRVLGIRQFTLADDDDVVLGDEAHGGPAVILELGDTVLRHLSESAPDAPTLPTEDDLGDERASGGGRAHHEVILDHLHPLAQRQATLLPALHDVPGEQVGDDALDALHDACDGRSLLRDCQRGGLGGVGHGTLLGDAGTAWLRYAGVVENDWSFQKRQGRRLSGKVVIVNHSEQMM